MRPVRSRREPCDSWPRQPQSQGATGSVAGATATGRKRRRQQTATPAETQRILRIPVNAPSSAHREGVHVRLQLGRAAALAYGVCGASQTGPLWTFGGDWEGDAQEIWVAPPTPAGSGFPGMCPGSSPRPLPSSWILPYLLQLWRRTRGRSSRCSSRGHSGHSPGVPLAVVSSSWELKVRSPVRLPCQAPGRSSFPLFQLLSSN